jgi:hypothetical protein
MFSAGNPPTGGIAAGASFEIRDMFHLIGSSGSLIRGMDYTEFGNFDDAPEIGEYKVSKSIWKALACIAVIAVVAVVIAVTAGAGAVALGVAIGGIAATAGVFASDIKNQQNSSWETYAAKGFSGAVTGAVMGGFAGALSPA